MVASALPASPPGRPRETIQSIQVLRGLASVAVVVYHCRLIFSQPEYGGYDLMPWGASRGWLGVNCFFVLSGFIIVFAHSRDLGRPWRLSRYAWKRFTRVFPVYWVLLTAFILASHLGLGATKYSSAPGNLLNAYALVYFHNGLTLPLQVAWTLFYEVQFYALFAIGLVSRTAGLIVLACWTAAILISAFVLGDTGPGLLHVWNLYFIIGIGVNHASTRLPARWGGALLLAGLAVLGPMAVLAGGHVAEAQVNAPFLLGLAVPFALVILGAVLLERHAKLLFPRWLLFLGAASYSIYLVHSATISLAAILNHRFAHGHIPPFGLSVGATLLAIAAGVAVHLALERPLIQVLQSLRRMRDGTGEPAHRRGKLA